MKTIPLLLSLAALSAGCESTKITDPKSGVTYERRAFLMKQGPKDVHLKDGDRTLDVKTGEKDQTAIASKLIELGQSLR